MKTPANWIQLADNALLRAAKRARETAGRTNTAVHVMRNGKIVKLMPGAPPQALREDPPEYGGRKKRSP